MTVPVHVLTNEEALHWLALSLVPGLGARRISQLLARYRTPLQIFRCPASELEAAGLAGSAARSIASGCTFEEAAEQLDLAKAAGAEIITQGSPHYPPLLADIFDPPALLFARGERSLLATVMVGVVGSRRATPYGVAVTERLSAELAAAGVTVVSGMARGIDTAAHKATLQAGGATVAVLGCGVDVVYPAENRKLATEIATHGLLLSEFPMRGPAYPQNFPVRNRVIAGMSAGVLVVEGAQYSGSSITARLALDQGKEVFAVPGNLTSPMSWGPNLLIKQGAHLVQDASDILDALPLETRQRLALGRLGAAADRREYSPALALFTGPNAPIVSQVVSLLSVDKQSSLDELIEKIHDASPSEIIAVLFELELQGLVRQLPGKNFVKVWYE
jgi:DNA processing protein